MSGSPRDLADVHHWSASLEKSRARREGSTAVRFAPALSTGATRDLSLMDPWELSLSRSRARRRAAETHLTTAPRSRARQASVGALAVVTLGAAAVITNAGSAPHSLARKPQRTATTHKWTAPAALPHSSPALAKVSGSTALASYKPLTAVQRAEKGMASKPVRRLQLALGVSDDGIFGPITEAAVRHFQAAHGLTVDGIVGPDTWAALGVHGQPTLNPPAGSLDAAIATEQAAARAHKRAAKPHVVAVAAAVHHVSMRSAIERLQAALHLAVDGEFGPETEAAIRKLQSEKGLTVDGIAGPATWSALGISGEPTLRPPAWALPHRHVTTTTSTPTPPAGGAPATNAPSVVAAVTAAANEIATRPYVWGGGHGSFTSEGYDCSGSVSYALHGGGLISSPEDSGEFESYGEAGPGRYITIYANAEHVWMTIDGRRFDTVALAEDGTRWSDSMASTAGYVVRHPDGL